MIKQPDKIWAPPCGSYYPKYEYVQIFSPKVSFGKPKFSFFLNKNKSNFLGSNSMINNLNMRSNTSHGKINNKMKESQKSSFLKQ